MTFSVYTPVLLLLALAVNNYVMFRRFKRLVAAHYPNHPELSQFSPFASPLGIAMNAWHFRQSRALLDMPAVEHNVLYVHHRAQVILFVLLAVSVVGLVLGGAA